MSHGNCVDAIAPLLIDNFTDDDNIFNINYCSTTFIRVDKESKLNLEGKFSVSDHIGLENGEIFRS